MRPYFLLPLLFLISSCLSLDYTPLEERPFWTSVEKKLETIRIPTPTPGRLRVGSSRVDITPPIGSPLAGYGARTSVGIHAPVKVRALVISDGQSKLVLISLEVLAITNELSEAVNKAIRLELPLEDSPIMLAASHTHSGPGGLGLLFWERLAAGPFNRDCFEWVVKRISRERIGAANPGVPHEPLLGDYFNSPIHFVLGLANDELGYIVPANDFVFPKYTPGPEYGIDRCGDDDHYEETVSASSIMARKINEALIEMLGLAQPSK